jgi:hypothetical protein
MPSVKQLSMPEASEKQKTAAKSVRGAFGVPEPESQAQDKVKEPSLDEDPNQYKKKKKKEEPGFIDEATQWFNEFRGKEPLSETITKSTQRIKDR